MNNIEKGPNENRVEDVELAREMASIENTTRDWAKILAEAIEDPDKWDTSKLPPWASGDLVMTSLDLHNLKRVGVTPEDIIRYGEESAESVERLAQYEDTLDDKSKIELLKEYFKQFLEGLKSEARKNKARDESKDVILARAPGAVAQPKEYRDAKFNFEESIAKRSLIRNRMRNPHPSEKTE